MVYLVTPPLVGEVVGPLTIVATLPTTAAATCAAPIGAHIAHIHPHVHQIHYLATIVIVTPAIVAFHIVILVHEGLRILSMRRSAFLHIFIIFLFSLVGIYVLFQLNQLI
jgi:choline-glycine betaine transporter